MTKATWKVIDRGDVPENAKVIEFDCPNCGRESRLPVVGTPIAQFGDGSLVFDIGPYAMPNTIKCRNCRHVFEKETPSNVR